MEDEKNPFSLNEKEVLEYYNLKGAFGKFSLKCKFVKTWILHLMAYSSPLSSFIIKVQRARGVKIGNFCHLSPYVLIDLVYPQLVTIEDNVTIGSNSMIFAHVNPTANIELKKIYPRKVEPVIIKKGAVVFPGCTITAGVTIGENSLIGTGSVVGEDIPDNCVALGNPARVVKKIEH
jgi:acetyltransferase-like isoleucine patch superfamily enzyme